MIPTRIFHTDLDGYAEDTWQTEQHKFRRIKIGVEYYLNHTKYTIDVRKPTKIVVSIRKRMNPKRIPLTLLDELEHWNENKSYVEHRRYLFQTGLISKENTANFEWKFYQSLLEYFLDITYVRTYQLH